MTQKQLSYPKPGVEFIRLVFLVINQSQLRQVLVVHIKVCWCLSVVREDARLLELTLVLEAIQDSVHLLLRFLLMLD